MVCNLCPRRCGALRTDTAGEGLCGMPALPVVARAALHPWEEPPISGTRGSGTVFFSGCSLQCVFCQNEAISHDNFGKAISPSRLREIFYELIAQEAHNINLVNPTHYAHAILSALEDPLPVPVVWNTGGYERLETLGALEGKIQIYLPDLKYMTAKPAAAYSGAADYPEVARQAILEMYRQTGPCLMEGGLLRRGVVIRHLLLPGGLGEAKAAMDWVSRQFPPGAVLFSLMSQYVPWGAARDTPPLNRALRASEIRAAQGYMADVGLEGFVQEEGADSAGFIPPFDLTGI